MEFNFNEIFEHMMQVHSLDTVVILAHMNPDGDAAGSVMGLAHYLHVVYPQYRVLPYLAETLDKGPKKQVLEDKIFDPFPVPKVEKYGVIVCDTATRERMIGRELYENAAASIVIDHHAFNEGYGDVNYTKISESCAENIYEILDWKRWESSSEMEAPEEHPTAADYIYMGILHDTGNFARAAVSTLQAALGLLASGVDHRYIMRTMHTQTLESLKRRSMLLDRVKRAVNGKVAYVFLTKENCQKFGFEYEDIHPIGDILRNCEDIELGFSMFEEESGMWRCSFRSDGKWVNVNDLMNPFGGGGHAGAAGLRKRTDEPEKLRDEIIREIEKRVL